MSRQTRALHKPGKAAASSALPELPKGTLRQMQARFAERDGRPAPKYPRGRSIVAVEVVAAVVDLPVEFSFADIRALFSHDKFSDMRLGQHLNLLVNSGQVERVQRGFTSRPTLYRRLPSFTAAQSVAGPPLTAVEIAYREFRASIKSGDGAPAPSATIDEIVHPSQR